MHLVDVTDIGSVHGQRPYEFSTLPRIGETVVLSDGCFVVLAIEHRANSVGTNVPSRIGMLVERAQ